MKRISVYIISIILFQTGNCVQLSAQDTIDFPLKIKAALEVSGPVMYFTDKNILNAEGYFSIDQNEKRAFIFGAGYLNYKYSQLNYEYVSKGIFLRTGFDFNLMKPEKSMGKYWTGIGLHYGLARFNSEIPLLQLDSYWGPSTSSISSKTSWGHFIEATPGVRAEIFRNLTIGWTISLRMLLHSGTGNDLRPIYLPGFGNATKNVSTGISYFISWNIPYKKIRVIIKKEEPEESDTIENTESQSTYGGGQIRQ